MMNDILGPSPAVKPIPVVTRAAQEPIDYVSVVKTALIWGWCGAAILAVILGALLHYVVGTTEGRTSLLGGANFGAMLGFLIGSIWGVTSTLKLELGKAALVGAVLGAADTTIHYFGELILIAPPDLAAYLYTMMGCAAGAAAGAFSVALRNFREDD